ncbi:sensor histidine kinase [Sulfurospirillum diekertiae]|uniref:histidine kinase n=1 Tax=Sulfurospirillum diekertiae TaxID=1854492 RepID=A0A1Y0HHZ4_9BACT|nr:HAMP domain-containing sensor histidine kinase [Sulfurospirillum diekertiae]ARU47632.1 Sensor protein ZraS [Sulfurospirillum diekertiae]ASC92478.1 Sensor protein ZraS [Sulfurospirillum diekertiae]
MKKIQIKYKLFLLFSVSFIGMLILAERSFKLSQENISNATTIFENSQSTQHLQENYIEPINALREMSLSLVMSPNEDYRKTIEADIMKQRENLEANFLKLDSKTYDFWEAYASSVEKTCTYIAARFEEGAFVHVNSIERDHYYALLNRLKALQHDAVNQAEHNFADIQTSAQALKYELAILILALSSLVFTVGYLLSNHIVSSILKLQEGLKDFFGYLETKNILPKPIELNSRDELDDMSKLLNRNIAQASANIEQDIIFVEDAINVVNDLKMGKLSSRLHATAQAQELRLLKDVVNAMIDNLESKINEEIFKRSEQEKLLIQQSKLASMGEMIGNIAHQWRQPLGELSALLINLQVKHEFNDLDDAYMLASIQQCVKINSFMSGTISDFQNFFKPSKEKEVFEISEACERAISILQASLKYHGIEFSFDISEKMEVLGYPNEFAQALLNILSNAKDVLSEREINNPFIRLYLKKGYKYILIVIEDNGGGIANEHMDRIFEPYFTTKYAKQGTGIGLYMTKMIIENNMGGVINVKNTESGALFTIKLPSVMDVDTVALA